MNPAAKQIRIVGGGLAGLSAAYYLQRAGHSVKLYESAPRLGGLIETRRLKHGLAEGGAHAFRNSVQLESLAHELGVELMPALPIARRVRLLESGSKVTRWPLRILATLRMCLGVFLFALLKPRVGQSVANWAKNIFGKAAATQLIGQVLQGIYATTADKLSASLVFGRFYGKARVQKPQIRGSVAPRGGMGELLDAMAARLRSSGAEMFINTKVEPEQIATWLQNKERVVLAVPVWEAARLLARLAPEVAASLAAVPSLPLEATTVFWNTEQARPLRPAFGILFEREIGPATLLGVLENDQIFAGRVWGAGVISETWISTGCPQPLLKIQRKRQQLLGKESKAAPLESLTFAWPQAIPVFGPDLELALRKDPSTKLATQGIFLVGNYMGPIGVVSILERSRQLAEKLS